MFYFTTPRSAAAACGTATVLFTGDTMPSVTIVSMEPPRLVVTSTSSNAFLLSQLGTIKSFGLFTNPQKYDQSTLAGTLWQGRFR